mgnify:CR=1 FL=1|tara:strand:+ start:1924 stop:4524 length:2601 start_codon:yes stop_codon:yes gene_type:complete
MTCDKCGKEIEGHEELVGDQSFCKACFLLLSDIDIKLLKEKAIEEEVKERDRETIRDGYDEDNVICEKCDEIFSSDVWDEDSLRELDKRKVRKGLIIQDFCPTCARILFGKIDPKEKILDKVIRRLYKILKFTEKDLFFLGEELIGKGRFKQRVDAVGYLKKSKSDDIPTILRSQKENPPFILVEVKKGKIGSVIQREQLKELLKASSAKFAVLSNGKDYHFYEKDSKGKLLPIWILPEKGEKEIIVKPKKEELSKIIWGLTDILRGSYHYRDYEIVILRLLALEKYLVLKYGVESNNYLRKSMEKLDIGGELNYLFHNFKEEYPNIVIESDFFRNANDSSEGSPLWTCLDYLMKIDFSNFTRDEWKSLIEAVVSRQFDYGIAQYTTPPTIAKFMISLAKPDENLKVADIAVGRGNILKEYLLDLIKDKKGDVYSKNVFGYDKNLDSIQFCRYLFFILEFDINLTGLDSLSEDISEKFDLIFCNSPFGGKIDSSKYNLGFKTSQLDSLFVLKGLKQLKENGRLIVVVPNSFLFQSGSIKSIREHILEKYNLQGIIQLPVGAFSPFTGIKTSILIIENNKKKDNSVFMASIDFKRKGKYIDWSKHGIVIKSFNSYLEKGADITDKDIDTLTIGANVYIDDSGDTYDKTYQNKTYLTSIDEIKKNDYDFSIERYDPELKKQADEIKNKYELKKLSDLAEVIPGKHVSSKEYTKKGIKYIRIKDLYDGQVILDQAYSIPEILAKNTPTISKKDILFSISGTIGKTAVYNVDEPVALSKGLVIIRPKQGIDPNYLQSLIENNFVKKQITSKIKGTTIKHFSINDLNELVVPIIPLDKQKDKIMEAEKIRKEIEDIDFKKKYLEKKLKEIF